MEAYLLAFQTILFQLSEREMDSICGMLPVYNGFADDKLLSFSDAVCLYIGFPFLMD